MYEKLLRIRKFEEKIQSSFLDGLVYGTTHLCIGQEAVSVGVVENLRDDDYLTYTYRGHGPCIARGMDVEAALAEIYGRETGVCGGLGGSMHLTDMELGLLGSFAIVGAGLPVAAGAAITAKEKGKGQVSVAFFGDGSTNIGGFHESMNLAKVWNLPMIFVCENNLYGEYSPILRTTPYTDLVRRAEAYDMPAAQVDGNDVLAVYEAAGEAIERARSGGGPTFLECMTYRQCGHSRSDPAKYRPEGELEKWLEHDPIDRFKDWLLGQEVLSAKEADDIASRVDQEIADAAGRAKNAPFPEDTDLTNKSIIAE